jgi:hypothetical protein
MDRSRQTGIISKCPQTYIELEAITELLPKWLWRNLIVSNADERVGRCNVVYTMRSQPLPTTSFFEVAPGLCVASPEFVYVQMANKLELPLLVKLGFELCGTYSPLLDENLRPIQRNEQLATAGSIKAFLEEASWLPGAKKAKLAAQYLLEGSASPRETDMAILLSLPYRHGGYGLEPPHMNYSIELDNSARTLTGQSCAIADLCWPEHKLDVEYDSTEWHSSVQQVEHDKSRANALGHMGYKVVFVTNGQMSNRLKFEALVDDLARLTKKRMRPPTRSCLDKRAELWMLLKSSQQFEIFRTRQCLWDV